MLNVQQQLAYYRQHPPRCIAEFTSIPTEVRGVSFDGHASGDPPPGDSIIEAGGTIDVCFILQCRCGKNRHRVFGYYWRNPDFRNELVYLSPLTAECIFCGKITDIIDTDAHGYDAELGGIVATARGLGAKGEFACDQCGSRPLALCARFEFIDDSFHSSDKVFRGREQELFSWFTLLGKCDGCSRIMTVAEFECA